MAKAGTAIAKTENVLIRAGECVLTVLPEFGGKIASVRIGDLELLQQPLAPIAARTRKMLFEDADASGWDECLPSVAGCSVETSTGTAEIPDHGDLWRVEWESQEPGTAGSGADHEHEASVTLTGRCFSLPLELERTLALAETARGWRIGVRYRLRNAGRHPVPWSWAAHPLFMAEKGDRLELPNSIDSLRVEGSGGLRLGRSGDTVAWPVATLSDGRTVDLRIAEDKFSGVGDKLFAGPLGIDENWCVLERPSIGVRIITRFDVKTTPYLGIWLCYGGWPDKEGPKQMCIALEPATAPVDSLAVQGPWSQVLGADETFSWPMEIEIEKLRDE